MHTLCQYLNFLQMSLIKSLSRLEQWFNYHFAWFFTNGMKAIQEATREEDRPKI
jgi:hypothetical protein